ncbi:hypothetical protein SNE40_004956 [Patella caerulea]|uniref:EF-hand domain-containing protein n=1 Tax=Patella caerulea TaxID=87958 RepID=A0AAN8KD61_PATCE
MAEPSKLEEEMKAKAKKAMLAETDPVKKLKLAFLSRGGKGIKNLTRWLRIMDDDDNKKLSAVEFAEGIQNLGINNLTKDELKDVFSRFDKDGSGQIEITEFLLMMQPGMSPHRKELVEAAFKTMDSTGDGVINIDDIEKTYDFSKHPKYINGDMNKQKCVAEFLNSFDGNTPDGKVTKEEFMAYYAALSCSIDNEMYFDLMMRQAWGV